MNQPRRIAYNVLKKVLCDDAYSAIALSSAIKENNLSQLDSAFVSALVYGVLERKLLLGHILKQYSSIPLRKIDVDTELVLYLGIYQLIFMDKVPQSACVNESVKLAKALKLFRSTGFINAVLRNIARNNCEYKLPDKSDELKFLSVKYSCPEDMIKLWLNSYGRDITLKILENLYNKPEITVRVNTLKTTANELIGIFESEGVKAQKVPYIENSLYISHTGSIENLNSYINGLFHVQDAASTLCCMVLSPKSGMTVCDVCCAPGGKTFTISQLMENCGKIYAYDIHENKLSLVNTGAKRLGIDIISTAVRDAATAKKLPNDCERVLCDVPCSGLGIIRKKPEIRYKKDTNIDNLPDLQYSILCNNADNIAIGGVVVYSTCTLCHAENRDNAERFLSEHKNFEPYPIHVPDSFCRYIDEPENMLTLFPFKGQTDGFFISAFRKVGEK